MASKPTERVNKVSKVVPLYVPQGKILDFIDGTLRSETPEEYVRQEIEKSLVGEYDFPAEEIAVECRIAVGSAKPREDLAIFPADVERHHDNIWAIAECNDR